VEEAAVLDALRAKRIAGYAVDVFDLEPLPVQRPFRSLPQVLATPHIGYVSEDLYRTFYGNSMRNITEWLDHNGSQFPLTNDHDYSPIITTIHTGDRSSERYA
jgi:phosphoglycerate dehydrogenase-like enzyme